MPGGPFFFAWAGGLITEPVTVVTNGTTHGASFETVALVGDAHGRQVLNLASTSGLVTGGYYGLSGPGIASGTVFVFDDSILSGLPNSLNLSIAAADEKSATFQATKAVAVGTVLGTLTQGSSAVSFTEIDLPAGTYGIYGTGIGETNEPVNTTEGTSYSGSPGVMIIGACYVVYDGAGGGTLGILCANSYTAAGTDDYGQPTKIVTWSIAAQAVRATASGTFPLVLSGFPTDAPTSITAIPALALGELEPGLVYNISGNGIPVGATFVAPTSGTEIILDLDATASDQNAILTITGPRTPNAPFDPDLHARFDEEVISVLIEQEEGGLATLTIDIKNPNVGLLALGRNLWVWLSWDQAWPSGAPDLIPLFNGRLIGVPKLAAGQIVQLQFLARPDDLNVQKADLAGELMVLPYYDPIWVTAEATPDTVLETYSALWHIDRTTLLLTASDILQGEDGIVEIGEAQAIYPRFSLQYGQPPLVATEVSGTVGWQQQATGRLDATDAIVKAFGKTGSAYKKAFPRTSWNTGGGALIQALCGDGLKSDWPKPGTSMGGGWSLSSQNDIGGEPLCYIVDASKTQKGGWLQPASYRVQFSAQAPANEDDDVTATSSTVSLLTKTWGTYTVDFPLSAFKIRMNLEYRADRRRTETITAVVTAGVQRELSDSAESDREAITLTSEYVGQGVDEDGALPIGSLAYRSYFQTARGALSFEYLLLAARAKMRARARAVDLTFAVDWQTALSITLRHSVRYTDRRVPGGLAVGKVKSYRLSCADGVMLGEFTIGCTIGSGESVTPSAGVPTYVNDGYVNPGYQRLEGAQTVLVEDEIAYQTLDDFVVADDGLDLTALTLTTALNECVVTNGIESQLTEVSKYQKTVSPTKGDPISKMKTMTTTVTLDMKPVTGAEYTTAFFPAVTQLTLPMTIDLAGD